MGFFRQVFRGYKKDIRESRQQDRAYIKNQTKNRTAKDKQTKKDTKALAGWKPVEYKSGNRVKSENILRNL